MRKRVIDAIQHRQTDLTPWNIELTSGFAEKLKERTGCKDPDAYLDNHMTRLKYKLNTRIDDEEEEDLFGVRWTKSKDGGDVGNVSNMLLPEPDLSAYSFPEINREFATGQCRKLEGDTRNTFRMMSITMCYFERAWSLRGMQNLLLDMIMNEAFTEALFEGILNHHLKLLDLVLDHDYEGIYIGDDWGQQRGLIMGPDMWRKYIRPGMQKMFDKIKGSGKYVILHSCGDIREILPDLVDMGLDVYNTIQPEIYDLEKLKREYGRHLTFYGAISTQQFLPFASVREVQDKTREVLGIMGKGGGYILSPTHAVTPDIPVDNILAMVDTARSFKFF